ncbi:hypothetical protein Tco_0774301 [Tanacetum coccineum]|uniref:Uncharacterized protein n=1 Tax=Tanacetum coccineum TaxID=301880 RepID=A0ABQ4ZN75_9ASTR
MSTPAYAQLVDTDTESDPEEAPSEVEELQSVGSRIPLMGEEFEAFKPIGTRTDSSHSSASSDSTTPLSPDHPLTHVSPTPTPTRVLFHRRTARIVVCPQPTLSPGMSARIAKAAALSLSSFRKTYRSSYETSSSSSLTLPVWKRYRGTSKLILDTDNDEGHGLGDEDHGLGDESQSLEDEGLGLEENEALPEDPEDDRVYTDVPAYASPVALVQTPPSTEWSSGFLPISRSSPLVSSPIASPLANPTPSWDVRELYTRSGVVKVEIFSHRYRFRSLEHEQERTAMTFGALWRPVLALEAWAGRVDTRLTDMLRDRYDDHRLIHEMLVQQAAIQCELQEMRGRVTALEQEKDRRE